MAEKDKNALEGPKNEAIAFLTTENEITEKKNRIYQHYKYVYAQNVNLQADDMYLRLGE
mgnify:CR=1 FL=1